MRQEIKDEADAEKRYLNSLADAEQAAKDLADKAQTDQARAAAEEVAAALRRAEEARQRAVAQDTSDSARRTFWQWLKGV